MYINIPTEVNYNFNTLFDSEAMTGVLGEEGLSTVIDMMEVSNIMPDDWWVLNRTAEIAYAAGQQSLSNSQ